MRNVVTGLLLVASASCSLDFEALEQPRVDGGGEMDGSIAPGPDAAAIDAGVGRDGGAPGEDAQAPQDGGAGEDASAPADGGPGDAGMTDARCPAAGTCGDPRCEGSACDDGLRCTDGDSCRSGRCVGETRSCPTDGCSVDACDETSGTCRRVSSMPDCTACGAGGTCCFARCSMLRDSASCGGCGLACDEETCTGSAPYTCVCVTHAGCPAGQTCNGGRCACSSSGQCAAGQTCINPGPAGYCTY